MNEEPDPRHRLIADLYQENWAQGPLGDLPVRAARQARRTRVHRRLAVVAVPLLALAAAVVLFQPSRPASVTPRVPAPAEIAASLPRTPSTRGFKVISDDELLADLHDRPLLILGSKDTGQHFVLLDP